MILPSISLPIERIFIHECELYVGMNLDEYFSSPARAACFKLR